MCAAKGLTERSDYITEGLVDVFPALGALVARQISCLQYNQVEFPEPESQARGFDVSQVLKRAREVDLTEGVPCMTPEIQFLLTHRVCFFSADSRV